jgi:hypothetical protein
MTMSRRVARVFGYAISGLVVLVTTGWAVFAIYYSNLSGDALRTAAAAAFPVAVLLLFVLVPPWRRAVAIYLVGFVALVAWWLTIPPSNNRDWQPDVALLPYAEIQGDRVTLRNIRNNEYRTETDYTVRHYDRTLDLNKLRTVDMFLIYWGSPAIAHTIMSFGFEGDQYVAFSIETRKEKGEDYSAIKGFFKQFEITYVVADERDVVKLRTNYRGEDVYLYRIKGDASRLRPFFLDYLEYVNWLRDHPVWYNALTHNCTTAILGHTQPGAERKWLDWRLVLNGYLDELAYDQGAFDRSLPFSALKAKSYINPKAKAIGNDPAFSAKIREGLPGMNVR